MLDVTSGHRRRSQPSEQHDATENDARASRNNICDADVAYKHGGQALHPQAPFQALHRRMQQDGMQSQQKHDVRMSTRPQMDTPEAVQHMFCDQNTLDRPAQVSGDIGAQPANTATFMDVSMRASLDSRPPIVTPMQHAVASHPRVQHDTAANAAAASVAAAMATVVQTGVAPGTLTSSHGARAHPGTARRGAVVVDAASAPAAARLRPEVQVVRRSVYDSTVPSRDELEQMTFMQKVQSVYHRPISDAAQVLDMGVTVLKKQCRNQGISRWPFRKLQSIDKLIQSVQMVLDAGPEEGAEDDLIKVMDTHARLVVMRHKIFENPEEDLDGWAKKLRQANFKQQYKRRQETNPFEHLPFKPTPEQQVKLLQDIEARRRQHAAVGARHASTSHWGGTGSGHPYGVHAGPLSAARQAQVDTETTCSSSEEEEEDAGDGRGRSRSARGEAEQGTRRPFRRSSRLRRFAETEVYDDGDPDYAPPEAVGPQMGHGQVSPEMCMHRVPNQLEGTREVSYAPASDRDASDRDMLTHDLEFRRGSGSVLGDIPMTDDYLPQLIPGFAYSGGGAHAGSGHAPQRSLSGLMPPQGGFDDGCMPPAQFLQQHSDVRQDWAARQARHSAQAQLPQHNPFGPGGGYGGMHPQRSTAPAGTAVDGVQLGTLMPHSMYPSQARCSSASTQHAMSAPVVAGHRDQFSSLAATFPPDPAHGVSQRLETLPEDLSLSAGLDALLHATTLPSPFTSGRLSASRPGEFAFAEDPCQGMRGARLAGHGRRMSGGGMVGVTGGVADDYAAAGTMRRDFSGHQALIGQRGHPMDLQTAGMRQVQPRQHNGDRPQLSDIPGRAQPVPHQPLHGMFQPMHGADEWNSLGHGM